MHITIEIEIVRHIFVSNILSIFIQTYRLKFSDLNKIFDNQMYALVCRMELSVRRVHLQAQSQLRGAGKMSIFVTLSSLHLNIFSNSKFRSNFGKFSERSH